MLFQTSKSLVFGALLLTSTPWLHSSSQVAANPVPDIPLELQKIKEIADMFLAYCSAADCQSLASQDASARRHLLEDDSVSNHVLEATVANLYPEGKRKLGILSCLAEVLACHLYLDNLYMPQVEDYKLVDVSLADKGYENQCAAATGAKAIQFTPSVTNIKDEQFLYLDKGPKSIQGVFQLDYQPCFASSLVSFAETSTSIGGISTGVLGDVSGDGSLFSVSGPLRAPSDYVYAMRVLGDHNWAFGK